MFLACTKVELQVLTVCIVVNGKKILNPYSDLDLDPMKLNIKLVRAFFIYYNVFQFRVPRSISFRGIMQKHTHTHTHTHTDSNEYPIVAFSKNATIIMVINNMAKIGQKSNYSFFSTFSMQF